MMILDLAKLFPNHCKTAHIEEWAVNLSDIKSVMREVKQKGVFRTRNLIQDKIELNSETIIIPPTDNGIVQIQSIMNAQKLIADYSEMKKTATGEKLERLDKAITVSEGYLNECNEKFGIKNTP